MRWRLLDAQLLPGRSGLPRAQSSRGIPSAPMPSASSLPLLGQAIPRAVSGSLYSHSLPDASDPPCSGKPCTVPCGGRSTSERWLLRDPCILCLALDQQRQALKQCLVASAPLGWCGRKRRRACLSTFAHLGPGISPSGSPDPQSAMPKLS